MVAGVGREVVAYKGRQVFVGDDVLQARDVQTSRALENVFVRPRGMLLGNSLSENIVPAVEEKSEAEERWVLVGPGVAQHVHVRRVCWLHDVRRREVVKRHPLRVVRWVAVLGHPQPALGVAPHEGNPRLSGRVDEATIDPGRHVVLLLPEERLD